jgi:hypothetical protein
MPENLGSFPDLILKETAKWKENRGQGGIRTRGDISASHAFQACAFDHSATCPSRGAILIRFPPQRKQFFPLRQNVA